jgi:PAS domain-containing protein
MAEEADREVMRAETPPALRLAFSRGDGDPAWLEITKVPISNAKGEVVGTLSTAEDVTDKERLEARLRQSQKMEAVGTLAGGLAHDFNNILTTIINSTEMALLDLEGDSQTAEDLRRVLAASRRGAGIVRQILTSAAFPGKLPGGGHRLADHGGHGTGGRHPARQHPPGDGHPGGRAVAGPIPTKSTRWS